MLEKNPKTFREYLKGLRHVVAIVKAAIAGIETFLKEYEKSTADATLEPNINTKDIGENKYGRMGPVS